MDGSGKDRFVGDIGVRDGVIASVGDLSGSTATNRVDASNMIVAPGFIDIHSHATSGSFWGSYIAQRPYAESYVRQGVTTAMGGQDGSSALDIGAFLDSLDVYPAAINIGLFIGHGSIRSAVIGEDDVQANEAQLAEMKAMVEQAMKDGRVSVDPQKSVDEQVKDIVEELRSIIALKTESLQLEIIIPAQFASQSYAVLKSVGSLKSEEWQNNGSLKAILEIPAAARPNVIDRLGYITKGSASVEVVQ